MDKERYKEIRMKDTDIKEMDDKKPSKWTVKWRRISIVATKNLTSQNNDQKSRPQYGREVG